MKLLLVRHGIAEEAETFIAGGGSDAQRPLTEIGRKKMRKGANRLRSQIKQIDLLASSPLLRARETAEIIAQVFGGLPIMERPELDFGYPPEAALSYAVRLVNACIREGLLTDVPARAWPQEAHMDRGKVIEFPGAKKTE